MSKLFCVQHKKTAVNFSRAGSNISIENLIKNDQLSENVPAQLNA
jgi:hypothetical protein